MNISRIFQLNKSERGYCVMNNEPNKVNVKEADLLQVNGGAQEYYFCVNPECVNYNIHMVCGGHCTVCGGHMNYACGLCSDDFDITDPLA